MTPSVAVVIPAHDAAPFLEVALQSLQHQTLPLAEVVVVDDGSTDGTHQIAERLGVRCIRQVQRGPAAARNAGIAATKAPLIAFLDADDWFDPHKLQKQVHKLEELGASAVCCNAWVVIGDRVTRRKNEEHQVPSVLTMERLLLGNPVICSTMLARREAVQQAGGFDEDPVLIATEDYDLWLRMARREPLAYLQEPLAFYRVHPGSLSGNTRFLQGIDRVMDKWLPTFGQEPHFRGLMERRRGTVRLELAWDLLREGHRAEARAMLAQARQHCGVTWRGCKMWLRSMLG
ncbi:MAG TPA: glycosyltransferase family 2 protein [Planctomycetota bacterium]|nr:glycosyltransferase family 2 protein [Planctomycetota bacterium]